MGTKEACLQGADALVICTEWQQFRSPDFAQIKELLTAPIIVDGRNLYDPARMKNVGLFIMRLGAGSRFSLKILRVRPIYIGQPYCLRAKTTWLTTTQGLR